MGTATYMAEKAQIETWSTLFPNEQLTECQSALFVKKLLAVSISSITYLRAIFPEYAFGDRCLEDLNLKILKDDGACPGACQVIKWFKGCFDALDKKYLRQIIIGIYLDANNPDTVIESYAFRFNYKNNKSISIYRNDLEITSASTATETKKATIKLLRTIIVLTQTLNALPDDVMMTMKLLYYDDITPSDYEPPGFHSADSDSFNFEKEPVNIKVGDVSTAFHAVQLRVKTDAKQFEIQDKNDVVNNDVISDLHNSKDENNTVDMDVKENDELYAKNTDNLKIVKINDKSLSDSITSRDSSEESDIVGFNDFKTYAVCCPCGSNKIDCLMLTCSICNKQQHSICYGIFTENNSSSVKKHICITCAKKPENAKMNILSTDPYLQNVTKIIAQATCLWRKTLVVCKRNAKISINGLANNLNIEKSVAQGLIIRLVKEGYLKDTKKKLIHKAVNREKLLNEGFIKYFISNENPDKKSDKQLPNNNTGYAEQMEILTNETENLNISNSDKENCNKEITTKPIRVLRSTTQLNKSMKRNRNALDGTPEFQISSSQEHNVIESKKRLKASVAKKSILV